MTLRDLFFGCLFVMVLFGVVSSCVYVMEESSRGLMHEEIDTYENCIEVEYCTLSRNELIRYEELKGKLQ